MRLYGRLVRTGALASESDESCSLTSIDDEAGRYVIEARRC